MFDKHNTLNEKHSHLQNSWYFHWWHSINRGIFRVEQMKQKKWLTNKRISHSIPPSQTHAHGTRTKTTFQSYTNWVGKIIFNEKKVCEWHDEDERKRWKSPIRYIFWDYRQKISRIAVYVYLCLCWIQCEIVNEIQQIWC